MQYGLLWMVTGLALVLAACQGEQEPAVDLAPISPVVATVNGVGIHESDIDGAMSELPDSLYDYRSDPQARSQVLHSLIRNEAIGQRAHELGLELDPMIRKRIDDARRQILIEAAKEWQFSNMEQIKPEEIESYYREHVADFSLPEQVHARHILVGSEKQVRQVIRQLKSKQADFVSLAASESLDDSNKARGGDLNWFARGMMVPEFDEAVFAMRIGQISGPVKSRFGWHVIELLGKRPGMLKPLEEVRGEIIGLLRQQQLEQWYFEIEQRAKINILKPEYRPGN